MQIQRPAQFKGRAYFPRGLNENAPFCLSLSLSLKLELTLEFSLPALLNCNDKLFGTHARSGTQTFFPWFNFIVRFSEGPDAMEQSWKFLSVSLFFLGDKKKRSKGTRTEYQNSWRIAVPNRAIVLYPRSLLWQWPDPWGISYNCEIILDLGIEGGRRWEHLLSSLLIFEFPAEIQGHNEHQE